MQPDYPESRALGKGDPRLETAAELLRLVREEAVVLERFQGQQLLDLLPRKEALIKTLQQRMLAPRGSIKGPQDDQMRAILGDCLQRIRAQNEHNRQFIESSLGYWRDLVGLLAPATYSRTGSESTHPHHVALRGARINREA